MALFRFLSVAFFLCSSLTLALELEDFQRILKQEHPLTVADFLESPSIDQATRGRFLVLKYSGSAQPANDDCPRVLVHNEDSSLVFSFNCGSLYSDVFEKHSAESIEIARKNPESGAYENFSLHLASKTSKISAPNPALCQTCHAGWEHPTVAEQWHWMGDEEIARFRDRLDRGGDRQAQRRYNSLDWENQVKLPKIRSRVWETWGTEKERREQFSND